MTESATPTPSRRPGIWLADWLRNLSVGVRTLRGVAAQERVNGRSGVAAAPVPAARSRQIIAIVVRLAGVLVAVAALWAGLWARDYTFKSTAPIRFTGDVNNAINQGTRVLWVSREVLREPGSLQPDVARNSDLTIRQMVAGEVRLYDRVFASHPNDHNYDFDYTPGRLLIAALWSRYGWSLGNNPSYTDAMAGPMMRLNTFAAAIAAIGAFFLVRRWWLCSKFGIHNPPPPGLRRVPMGRWWGYERNLCWVAGLVSAILVWLSPAVIIDSHGFPQWDVWVLPFAIWGLWCASHGSRSALGWAAAGVLVAFGAMFKGQILLGMLPVLVVWACLSRPLVAPVSLCIGLLAGTMSMAWPWMLKDGSSKWLVAASATVAILSLLIRWLPLVAWRLTAGICLVALAAAALWASGTFSKSMLLAWLLLATAACAVCMAGIRRSDRPARHHALTTGTLAILFATSTTTLLCGLMAGGSLSWLHIGFIHPTDHYLALNIGPTANIPAVLGTSYGLQLKDTVATLPTGPGWAWMRSIIGPSIDLKQLLGLIYLTGSAVIGLGLWRSSSRGSRRALVAMSAGWVLMFAILPQMHERYLIWGAAMTALTATTSPALLLLHLYVTLHAFMMVLHQMMICGDRAWSPLAMRLISPTGPGIGWSLAIVTLTYIYLSVARTRRT